VRACDRAHERSAVTNDRRNWLARASSPFLSQVCALASCSQCSARRRARPRRVGSRESGDRTVQYSGPVALTPNCSIGPLTRGSARGQCVGRMRPACRQVMAAEPNSAPVRKRLRRREVIGRVRYLTFSCHRRLLV
jgi:hypothetical protein